MNDPTRNWYEGSDGQGGVLRIPRFVDPAVDGTRLAEAHCALFRVSAPDDSISIDDFDAMLIASIPSEVMSRIDEVVKEATVLAARGLVDQPPIDGRAWRRGIWLSWLHARDLAVVLDALGHPHDTAGRHDVEEYALGKRLKERLASADVWYRNWVLSLGDEESVNIGFFNPYLAASMFKWGDAKTGVQNAMDAHRLAPHHLGTPESPLDWVERAANFVVHHVPREHWGIRHEPRGDWSILESRMAAEPTIKDAEVGKQIARDVAALFQLLEKEGKVVPWQLLRVPALVLTPSLIEQSFLVVNAALLERQVVPFGAGSAEAVDLAKATGVIEHVPEAIASARREGREDLARVYEAWLAAYREI